MRISTTQIYNSGLTRMQTVQSELNELQTKVSTGYEINKPSDDPIKFSQSLKLSEEISINEQFNSNIQMAEGRNELLDSNLEAAVNVLQRMRDLALQASNDTLNQDDRQSISEEIRILQDELAGIMNAQDGSGDYLFAGFQGDNQPFIERSGGGYDYVGDEGQKYTQISASSYVAISDSGKDLFVDVKAAENTIVTSKSVNNNAEGKAEISVGQVFDQSALDEAFPEKWIITFNDPEDNQDRRTYTVRNASDGSPVVGTNPAGSLENITYDPGEDIEFNGIRVAVSGNPQAGDTFFVESSGNQSVMTTIERFALALEDLADVPITIEATESLIGRASPARPTLSSAGNYVAAQTLTVTGPDGTYQNVTVNENEEIGSVAANLNALAGITATYDNAEATLNFFNTDADEGDIIQFNLNGIAVQATAGANAAATYANIDTALAGVLPTANLSYTNNGSGEFGFVETSGADIAIDSFSVTDFPGVELDIAAGITPGETIDLTLTGSNGETVNVSYTAATADIDELTTEINNAIAAAGHAGVMNIAQPAAGQPAVLRYTGDTDGDAQIVLSGLNDSGAGDVALSVTPLAGSDSTDSTTNGAVSVLRANSSVDITAEEGRSSVAFAGVNGYPVTLQDGGNDSSAVAATLDYTLAPGYEISSNIGDAYGGLISDANIEDTLTLQFREAIDLSLANIDNALENISRSRSGVGARLTMLETTLELNEGLNVELQTFLSDIVDLDYAEAITEVQLKSFVLQSAQSTFVKMAGLSLFNYI
ncbi:MAG: flagellar hook-associated protein FlgL [Pseudomonadota bacterium]|nr:flagellar hook-associated protein FlgL [Pseudomonadota bacterium]